MTHVIELNAQARDITGKANRKLSKEGLVPAVVYGSKVESRPLSVRRSDLDKLLQEATVGATLIELAIEGEPKPLDVIIKEVQRHVVKDHVLHVDFWAVDLAHTLQTEVPIIVTGSAKGEREGGVLMQALREIKVEANPKDLPEHIQVDVTPLEIGDNLTVGDIVPPRGVTFLEEPDTVVATVTAPTIAEEAEVELEEVTEVPEVGEEAEEAEE